MRYLGFFNCSADLNPVEQTSLVPLNYISGFESILQSWLYFGIYNILHSASYDGGENNKWIKTMKN